MVLWRKKEKGRRDRRKRRGKVCRVIYIDDGLLDYR